MPEFELSQAAQHWVNVVLIWVGFGTLAGLSAKVIIPLRQPAGSMATLVVGMVGSVVGLLVLSLFVNNRQLNPISPLGFLAATAGAFLLLIGYQLVYGLLANRKKDSGC